MTIQAIAFATSFLAFITLLLMVTKERVRERRFFAPVLRRWLDLKVGMLGQGLLNSWDHFIKYIVQLNWYYSIHAVLKNLLKLIVAFYTYFESMFERNRTKTKQLRTEKRKLNELNHLYQMAEHKKGTALTDVQKSRLKKKKLEGKY